MSKVRKTSKLSPVSVQNNEERKDDRYIGTYHVYNSFKKISKLHMSQKFLVFGGTKIRWLEGNDSDVAS